MRIDLADDNDNWRKWGALVRDFIVSPETRPGSTADLNTLMKNRGIAGNVAGPDRPVQFVEYADDGVFYLALPSRAMLEQKLPTITAGPFPLPAFYTVAFGGAAEVSLSQDEAESFALRRIGEYTINFCC
jgi:hypothetical protein